MVKPKSKAGRPKGRKNKNTKQITIPKESTVIVVEDLFISQLEGAARKSYTQYKKGKIVAIDELKKLYVKLKMDLDRVMSSRSNQYYAVIAQAEKDLADLIETGLIGGKKASQGRIATKIATLKDKIKASYKLDSRVTTLSTEVRNVLVEIDRIDNGKDDRQVNIFNILNGSEKSPEVQELENTLFPDVMDADIMDDEDKK